MDLFLDTSVLLSACGSANGASRFIIDEAATQRWKLISALSVKPDALLTLDRADFHDKLGTQFYGIDIRTPGEWLMEMREAGKL